MLNSVVRRFVSGVTRRTVGGAKSASSAYVSEMRFSTAAAAASASSGSSMLEAVKALRKETGAPLNGIKEALTESNGDMDGARAILRERGLALANKKSLRATKEGLVCATWSSEAGTLLEIACETDFVASTASLQELAGDMTTTRSTLGVDGDAATATKRLGDDAKDQIAEVIMKTGENIRMRRSVVFGQGVIGGYVHGKKGSVGDIALGKAAALVELNGGEPSDAGDLAMHVVGLKPGRLSGPATDADDKSEALLDQNWLKDPSMTVSQWLDSRGAAVSRFVRYEVGGDTVHSDEVDAVADDTVTDIAH